MRILLWHVHGSWATAFVQGRHEYVLPVLPDRSADGLGRATSWEWPAAAREVAPADLRDLDLDLVLLQRPHEVDLCREWTGREPGRDLPALYLEHNTPKGDVPFTRHPLADQRAIPIVHVTHFNELFWDNGSAPTAVIEHGIVDPGHLYTGELPRVAVAVNEPIRRGRVTGTDLIPRLGPTPVDVFGMQVEGLPRHLGLPASRITAHESLTQADLHREMARRRVYVHTPRWTSLGLSLLEAMHLGMPVVGLDTTEATRAVPPDAGVLSTRVDDLRAAVERFVADPDEARAVGERAREAALARYGLQRFLDDWDVLLASMLESRALAS